MRSTRPAGLNLRAIGAPAALVVAKAALVMAALVSASGSGCQCGTAPPPNKPASVGQLSAVNVDGGFELRLTNLERPVRELQVDVKLAGASAHSAAASGGSDVLEAGLDAPKSDFTVVVGDTRRLNLPDGAVVKVTTDHAPSSIALSRALAVDDTGKKRDITVVVP